MDLLQAVLSTMTTFKPMLAGKAPADLSALKFPLLVSPKLDGIRCIIRDGKAMSRKLLPIPNKFVQSKLARLPDGLDGELMLDLPGSFNAVQSAVMSVEGEPDFTFCVFDWHGAAVTFESRLLNVTLFNGLDGPHIDRVPHIKVHTTQELMALEEQYVGQGFEGLMIRSLDGPYKCGRSTEKEGYLLKVKRFEDAEAVIIGCLEMMHNDNEATTNALGHTKRSHAKEGKRPAGVLGKFQCATTTLGCIEFECGAGFTAAQRAEFWQRRDELIGQTIKFKFQPDPSGGYVAPRCPIFLGFRSEIDT